MPAKAQRPGLARTHSRSSSGGGGGSKLALNLQFTQKDPTGAGVPPTAKFPTKKANGHVLHEPQRTSSPFPRTNSKQRVRSKEHIPPPALLKRAPTPHAAQARPTQKKTKVGFTIASPGSDEDSNEDEEDDEWVSSESGGPSRQDSDAETEVVPVAPPAITKAPPPPPLQLPTEVPPIVDTADTTGVRTPRVERSPTRPFQHRSAPPSPPRTPIATQHPPPPPPQQALPPPPDRPHQQQPHDSRSETPLSPQKTIRPSKRGSMTRPSSIYSNSSKGDTPLRPHPLIRGNSYGIGHGGSQPPKPSPLAPLTVTSDAGPARLSTSASPPKTLTASTSPSSPQPSTSPSSRAHNNLRRTSISSVQSAATLPVTSGSSNGKSSHGHGHDRTRTLSTISSSSSSSVAALSSLAQRPTVSRAPSPQHVSYFPPPPPNRDQIHPLLPPPYLSTHLGVTMYCNPIRESFDRVLRAKQGIRR